MKSILLILINLAVFTTNGFCDDIVFIQGDLKEAKTRAMREGKLIILDFWASYCTPCRMMDEYTFTDPSVVSYVDDYYVPVKIDIQSFDGYDLKKQFGVTVLPTVIILNSKGMQLGRHEESMGVNKFMETLRKYNTPQNRVKVTGDNYAYNANTGYSNTNVKAVSYTSSADNKATVKNVVKTAANKAPEKYPSADYHRNTVAASNTKPTTASRPVNIPVVGAKHVEVSKESFTIQLGAFAAPDNLQDYINKIKNKTGEARIFVSKKEENGRSIYRVLVGHFDTRLKAQNFLKSIGLNGYVRDFAGF